MNEVACSRSGVVARNGSGDQEHGQTVFRLSTKSTTSSHSTTTSMVLAGPMEGRMFLIVIDAHSKWIEVFPMATATAMTTIQRLRQLFAQFGIPESIVLDNGSQFTAGDLQEFCRMNGIRHISSCTVSAFVKWIG